MKFSNLFLGLALLAGTTIAHAQLEITNDGKATFSREAKFNQGLRISSNQSIWLEGRLDIGANQFYYPLHIDDYYGEPVFYSEIANPGMWYSFGYIGKPNYQFSGVYASSVFQNYSWVSSDVNKKENIAGITNALDKISRMDGKSYNYINRSTAEERTTQASERKVFDRAQFGFIAQELKEVVPEAVFYSEEEESHYVNYNAIIPILVEALKEQQAQIELLKEQVGSTAINMGTASQALLMQNTPNPFNTETHIRLYLPEEVQTASLHIFDLQGKLISVKEISDRGETEVIFNSYELTPGMYNYSLVSDNVLVATKQMILTQ